MNDLKSRMDILEEEKKSDGTHSARRFDSTKQAQEYYNPCNYQTDE